MGDGDHVFDKPDYHALKIPARGVRDHSGDLTRVMRGGNLWNVFERAQEQTGDDANQLNRCPRFVVREIWRERPAMSSPGLVAQRINGASGFVQRAFYASLR